MPELARKLAWISYALGWLVASPEQACGHTRMLRVAGTHSVQVGCSFLVLGAVQACDSHGTTASEDPLVAG